MTDAEMGLNIIDWKVYNKDDERLEPGRKYLVSLSAEVFGPNNKLIFCMWTDILEFLDHENGFATHDDVRSWDYRPIPFVADCTM